MPANTDIIKKIADDTGLSTTQLTISGLLAFLREKKRSIMLDILNIASRYDAVSSKDLEKKIENGNIPEHPAWEDLIQLENLESALALINKDIKAIQ
ncbi:MAG: hypothetical protein AB1498_04095 [bacterium]